MKKNKGKTNIKIEQIMNEVKDLLLLKNEQYGDSALSPVGIFAQGSASDLIRVRMDDKISRLALGNEAIEKDEDIIVDLCGYCVLLLIAMRNEDGFEWFK
tara:strand:+ start:8728 stop:9027 length:300 start_codon:yes stop_codon:yes gene_type:complete